MSQSKNSAADWFKSATTKCERGDFQEALTDYTKAMDLDPKYTDACYGRGLAKSSLQDYQGAVADFTKAIDLNPDHSDAFYSRGNAYLGLGQKSKAHDDFMKTIDLGYSVPRKLLDKCR
jgi:tetratricopeptide (TPR) repeat protein